MKTKNILASLLLFAMSFQVLHDYALNTLDSHACEVSEYVVEFSQPISDDFTGDICNLHSEFHQIFLLPEQFLISNKKTISQKPAIKRFSYEYTLLDNRVKPPINS